MFLNKLFMSRTGFCNVQSCAFGFYKCHRENYCIALENVCDGINQCWQGDDERNCGNLLINFVFFKMICW